MLRNVHSITLKVLGIGVLALLMLIPLAHVQWLIAERSGLRDQAIESDRVALGCGPDDRRPCADGAGTVPVDERAGRSSRRGHGGVPAGPARYRQHPEAGFAPLRHLRDAGLRGARSC